MMRAFPTGAYKNGLGVSQNRPVNWVLSVVLLFLTLLLSFTGYLLPWDQLAYWTVTVGTNITSAAPLIGDSRRFKVIGPRDVAPDGKYFVGSGTLVWVTTVFSFAKLQQAIEAKNFAGNKDGIPVVNYDAVREAEVMSAFVPSTRTLTTNGTYTSLHMESAIAKWKLGTWEVVDKIPVSYNIGHLAIPGGDTVHPGGIRSRAPE